MTVSYTLIRSNRKTIAIEIAKGGQVLVRCPNKMPAYAIEDFIQKKANWIQTHVQKAKQGASAEPFTDEQIQAFRQRTNMLLQTRLPILSQKVGVNYQKVTVRNQQTRWGSCSSKGNLNFNCLLALVPDWVLDYVIVHELCHRKQMNHSCKFWLEVEKVCPDYKAARKWLKENGNSLISRL